jgi:hypothetical protein
VEEPLKDTLEDLETVYLVDLEAVLEMAEVQEVIHNQVNLEILEHMDTETMVEVHGHLVNKLVEEVEEELIKLVKVEDQILVVVMD